MSKVNLFWFRRDLRLNDNAGLYHALKGDLPVALVFIFDKNILNDLEDEQDARVTFIRWQLLQIQEKLKKHNSSLMMYYGTPEEAFKIFTEKYDVATVYTNHDYEPYARERDKAIEEWLIKRGIGFHHYKDQVIFETDEIGKDDGDSYAIFTPYSRKWLEKLDDFYLKSYPVKKYLNNLLKQNSHRVPSLESMGFSESKANISPKEIDEGLISHYDKTRDYPAQQGTSRLGIHLRFGTISIRKLATEAQKLNRTFLNELIWRDFYQMILWHHPQVVNTSFHPDYDKITWRNNENEFEKWSKGETGYPIVDAGMRQLNEIGYMHNRVRMIVASFLTKHLLIDWRWGEAYFGKKLLDYELASNNGGWQWAAGSGCDAVPYFRIFNPYLQTKKFDPKQEYIKQWVKEFDTKDYPKPIVDHKEARERALKEYKKAVKK